MKNVCPSQSGVAVYFFSILGHTQLRSDPRWCSGPICGSGDSKGNVLLPVLSPHPQHAIVCLMLSGEKGEASNMGERTRPFLQVGIMRNSLCSFYSYLIGKIMRENGYPTAIFLSQVGQYQ